MAECLGHGFGNLGLGENHASPVLCDVGTHLLLAGNRVGLPLLGQCLGFAGIGLGLICLQPGADVLADVDICDINRNNLERRMSVETQL